ncbi:Holliday junction branch migration protein RuvA [Puteibacter caeruleilacunae]|nr:Holliday junction branch migration protein RuvA [Puteibacter caeruleilacunae]
MIEYIKGTIDSLTPANVVIEANSIGWFVNISLHTYSRLSDKKDIQLFIHEVIREDAHTLYGFSDPEERELFRSLITVNGVGSATAIMMLSSLSPEKIVEAISMEEVNVLKGVKGIGAKTAQRIIIDLKDKIAKSDVTDQIFQSQDNTIKNEALSALIMLGFSKKDADKSLDKVLKANPGIGVEGAIKAALKQL